MCRIGIIGFGQLGQYLAEFILSDEGQQKGLQLAFVWNRSRDAVSESADPRIRECQLDDLNDFKSHSPDIVVEVAHPVISESFGVLILEKVHYFCGSPACFADQELEKTILQAVSPMRENSHALFVPAGALWGSLDIQKMAASNSLVALTVTMKKNFHHLKLKGELKEKLDLAARENVSGECLIFDGSVRTLCALAPNNTNTMACAAIASLSASSPLGFDGTRGRLIADNSLEGHVVEVEVEGQNGYKVTSSRYNPARAGSVTGNATFASFVNSLLGAVELIRSSRETPNGICIV